MSRFASAPWPVKAAYVGVLGAGAGALVLTLALAVALAGLRRLSAHIDPAAVPAWFWYYRADPTVRRWLGVGLLVALGLAGALALGVVRSLRPPLHGAARWASEAELVRGSLRARQGIVLGHKSGRPLVFGGLEHVMLYAPTRTGKGVGVVIPNLLTWPQSLVVLDIKGENWAASAGYRAAHGQRVLLFDPLSPDGRTARFNPLAHIDRADAIATLDELQKIAGMLFPTADRVDPFWAEAARTGFIGVGAFVAETPDLPFTLGEVFRQLTQGSPKQRFPQLITERARAGRPLSAGCVSALTDFCAASDNTFASIRQTITARMGLWLNPRVDAATAVSDFDLRGLRGRSVSLYLGVTPDNLVRVAPLYNLLLQQLIDLNTRALPAPSDTRQVLVVLDEFARLGHAAVIAHGFSFVAGYGIRLLAVLQSPAQLRAEYGPDLADEIMANCGVEIVFAPKEIRVAQDLSERLGYWTYPGRSNSRPTALSTGRRSMTESDQRRALMLPQELIALPDDQLIVLRAGLPPVRGRKLLYYRTRDLRRRVSAPPAIPAEPVPIVGPGTAAVISPTPAASSGKVEATEMEPASGNLISLMLDEADLDDAPPEPASEAEVRAWADAYIDRAALETDLAPEREAEPPDPDGR
jgi:type IV secretion system protein VirD4